MHSITLNAAVSLKTYNLYIYEVGKTAEVVDLDNEEVTRKMLEYEEVKKYFPNSSHPKL